MFVRNSFNVSLKEMYGVDNTIKSVVFKLWKCLKEPFDLVYRKVICVID